MSRPSAAQKVGTSATIGSDVATRAAGPSPSDAATASSADTAKPPGAALGPRRPSADSDRREQLGSAALRTPGALPIDRVDRPCRSDQRHPDPEPERVLVTRPENRHPVRPRRGVQLGRQIGRDPPGKQRLLAERHDVDAVAETGRDVRGVGLQAAVDSEDRDVGVRAGQDRVGIIADRDAERSGEPGDVAEVAPDSGRAAGHRSHDLCAAGQQLRDRERAHRADAVHDDANRAARPGRRAAVPTAGRAGYC